MESNYQDRLAVAITRVGDQTELARRVSAIIGREVKPQSIQYLSNRNAAKPAQGSSMTTAIAAAAGIRPQWLEYGEEPMIDPLSALDRTTYALVIAAAAKLNAPGLNSFARETAISALNLVANSDVSSYDVVPANAMIHLETGQTKHSAG